MISENELDAFNSLISLKPLTLWVGPFHFFLGILLVLPSHLDTFAVLLSDDDSDTESVIIRPSLDAELESISTDTRNSLLGGKISIIGFEFHE